MPTYSMQKHEKGREVKGEFFLDFGLNRVYLVAPFAEEEKNGGVTVLF